MTYKNNKKIPSKELNETFVFARIYCRDCGHRKDTLYNDVCEDCLKEQGKWVEGTK